MLLDVCFAPLNAPEGDYFDGDSQKRAEAAKAERLGNVLNVGPELEYYYFKDPNGTEVLDHGGYFRPNLLDMASDLRRDTILLERWVYPSSTRITKTVHLSRKSTCVFDALSMADNVMTYKMVGLGEIAMKHGVYASFMPKPISGAPGSGMHIHQSLFDEEGNNAFFDANDPDGYNLSKVAKHYIAGLFKYVPEFN